MNRKDSIVKGKKITRSFLALLLMFGLIATDFVPFVGAFSNRAFEASTRSTLWAEPPANWLDTVFSPSERFGVTGGNATAAHFPGRNNNSSLRTGESWMLWHRPSVPNGAWTTASAASNSTNIPWSAQFLGEDSRQIESNMVYDAFIDMMDDIFRYNLLQPIFRQPANVQINDVGNEFNMSSPLRGVSFVRGSGTSISANESAALWTNIVSRGSGNNVVADTRIRVPEWVGRPRLQSSPGFGGRQHITSSIISANTDSGLSNRGSSLDRGLDRGVWNDVVSWQNWNSGNGMVGGNLDNAVHAMRSPGGSNGHLTHLRWLTNNSVPTGARVNNNRGDLVMAVPNSNTTSLLVLGDLHIEGNINLPNLRAVLVTGRVTVAQGANFVGPQSGTTFIIAGSHEAQGDTQGRLQISENATIRNVAFYVDGREHRFRGTHNPRNHNSSDNRQIMNRAAVDISGNFNGNAVFYVDGHVNISGNGSIGASGMAPQLYVNGELRIPGSPTLFGIYAHRGNNNVSGFTLSGLLIGNAGSITQGSQSLQPESLFTGLPPRRIMATRNFADRFGAAFVGGNNENWRSSAWGNSFGNWWNGSLSMRLYESMYLRLYNGRPNLNLRWTPPTGIIQAGGGVSGLFIERIGTIDESTLPMFPRLDNLNNLFEIPLPRLLPPNVPMVPQVATSIEIRQGTGSGATSIVDPVDAVQGQNLNDIHVVVLDQDGNPMENQGDFNIDWTRPGNAPIGAVSNDRINLSRSTHTAGDHAGGRSVLNIGAHVHGNSSETFTARVRGASSIAASISVLIDSTDLSIVLPEIPVSEYLSQDVVMRGQPYTLSGMLSNAAGNVDELTNRIGIAGATPTGGWKWEIEEIRLADGTTVPGTSAQADIIRGASALNGSNRSVSSIFVPTSLSNVVGLTVSTAITDVYSSQNPPLIDSVELVVVDNPVGPITPHEIVIERYLRYDPDNGVVSDAITNSNSNRIVRTVETYFRATVFGKDDEGNLFPIELSAISDDLSWTISGAGITGISSTNDPAVWKVTASNTALAGEYTLTANLSDIYAEKELMLISFSIDITPLDGTVIRPSGSISFIATLSNGAEALIPQDINFSWHVQDVWGYINPWGLTLTNIDPTITRHITLTASDTSIFTGETVELWAEFVEFGVSKMNYIDTEFRGAVIDFNSPQFYRISEFAQR